MSHCCRTSICSSVLPNDLSVWGGFYSLIVLYRFLSLFLIQQESSFDQIRSISPDGFNLYMIHTLKVFLTLRGFLTVFRLGLDFCSFIHTINNKAIPMFISLAFLVAWGYTLCLMSAGFSLLLETSFDSRASTRCISPHPPGTLPIAIASCGGWRPCRGDSGICQGHQHNRPADRRRATT